MVTVKVNAKVAAACAKDNSRFAIAGMGVWTRGKHAHCVATDGRRLVVSRTKHDGEQIEPVSLPGKAVQRMARKRACNYTQGTDTFSVDGVGPAGAVESVKVLPYADDSNFPSCADVIPDPEDYVFIGVNAQMLRDLLAACESAERGVVAIGVHRDPEKAASRPVMVTSLHYTDEPTETETMGVLMPVYFGGDREDTSIVMLPSEVVTNAKLGIPTTFKTMK